ncbi:MAG TPA: alpha-amylase family glycosyl hydrolase, partial [Chroococcales cyanobacterium]
MKSRTLPVVLAAISALSTLTASQTAALSQETVATARNASQNRPENESQPWWKSAIVYEIYPRSFGDADNNGMGDLKGITEHLDYLKDLGVGCLWITPCFPSPQVDFGYDISDYTAIAPEYGTMADFDELVKEAKKRDIRICLDLVLNHTSDKCKWFEESASSKTNPKRDWYIWRDGKGKNQPPNNWLSCFGHSAWKFDPKTDQYYYHCFYPEQPDLNWRNPEVRKAMYDVVRFWLDRGVAGFRLDAIARLFEDPQLRDNPVLKGTDRYG